MIKKTPEVYKALQVALYFQRQRGIYSELLLGDKDTFRLAWRLLKVPYHMVRVNLASVGGMEGSQFCGTTMAQYAPMWGEKVYGPPPVGYVEPENPQIMFIHMNLEKLRGVHDTPNTYKILHYEPPILPNAKNTLIGGRIGPCTWLESCAPGERDCKVRLDDFDGFLPNFRQEYQKIFKTLSDV